MPQRSLQHSLNIYHMHNSKASLSQVRVIVGASILLFELPIIPALFLSLNHECMQHRPHAEVSINTVHAWVLFGMRDETH